MKLIFTAYKVVTKETYYIVYGYYHNTEIIKIVSHLKFSFFITTADLFLSAISWPYM